MTTTRATHTKKRKKGESRALGVMLVGGGDWQGDNARVLIGQSASPAITGQSNTPVFTGPGFRGGRHCRDRLGVS